jgi:hypothetical protein
VGVGVGVGVGRAAVDDELVDRDDAVGLDSDLQEVLPGVSGDRPDESVLLTRRRPEDEELREPDRVDHRERGPVVRVLRPPDLHGRPDEVDTYPRALR